MSTELTKEKILEKINLVLGSINQASTRSMDQQNSETIRNLAAAYKDLKATPEIMEEEDTDTDGQQTH